METRKYCAYNKTRETFLSSKFTVIDAALDPLRVLKLLIEGLPRGSGAGVWLTHFKDVPVAQALSPFDLVYMDKDYRVVHGVELTTEGTFAPFKGEPASALVLPARSLSASKTTHGDQLLIRFAEEAESQGERAPVSSEEPRAQKAPAPEPRMGMHFATATSPEPAALETAASELDKFIGSRPAPAPAAAEPRVQRRSRIELTPMPRPAPETSSPHGRLTARPLVDPPRSSEPIIQEGAAASVPEVPAPVEPVPLPSLSPSSVIPEAVAYRLQPEVPQVPPPAPVPISSVPTPRPQIERREPPASPRLVYPVDPLATPESRTTAPDLRASALQRPVAPRVHPRFESQETAPIETPPFAQSPAASASPARAPLPAPAVSVPPVELAPAIFPNVAPAPDRSTQTSPLSPEPLPVPAIVRPRTPLKPKEPDSLKLRILRWLFPELAIQESAYPKYDRRRAFRIPMPDLVAYYWTGGAPRPRRIGNVSVTGFYLQTEERWMPGTVIRMTLQLVGSTGEHKHDSVTVHSRLVRWGPDGEGFEFVLAGFDRLSKGR